MPCRSPIGDTSNPRAQPARVPLAFTCRGGAGGRFRWMSGGGAHRQRWPTLFTQASTVFTNPRGIDYPHTAPTHGQEMSRNFVL